MTLHRTPGGELLQHSSATVVLVVVADQKPGPRERATCATPQPGSGGNLITSLPGWFAETPYLQWFPPPENIRDVTYQEDKSLVRTRNAPRVMASLRSLAISVLRQDGHANIAAANRHHARDPQRTLKLLQAA
jgi:hypothetical protein